jgi:Cu(I)/Ag(I) efflux system protein CusF
MKRIAALILGIIAATAQAQGMDHKNMPGMQHESSAAVHEASGTVTKLDRSRARVTIRHSAVKTLDWPPMSMAFAVRDKALLEKLQPDRKVDFQFVQEGKDYVITGVK